MIRWWRNSFRRTNRLPLYDKPARERHPISITCSILSVASMVVALGLPEWATSNSSHCHCRFGLTSVYCILPGNTECMSIPMTTYYKTSHEILISCILSISVLTLISSIVATVVSFGFPREKFEFIRHFSVFNIVSLLCVILVAGFWLAVCETLPVGANEQAIYKNTVKFGYGYYVYLCSGLFSLVAASFNLIRARTAAERRRNHRRNYRQRYLFRSRSPPVITTTVSQTPSQQEEEDNPPEYSVATTSFIETPNDNEPLINELPPYAP